MNPAAMNQVELEVDDRNSKAMDQDELEVEHLNSAGKDQDEFGVGGRRLKMNSKSST